MESRHGRDRPALSDLARSFEKLTQEDANDASAWFNLGLSRAWLGEAHLAVEALDKYIDREPDEPAAVEAASPGRGAALRPRDE